MSRVRVQSFSVSIDGFGGGPNQDLANPMGVGGRALHEWVFATQTFKRMLGRPNAAEAALRQADISAALPPIPATPPPAP
jgi:hypothetical protein